MIRLDQNSFQALSLAATVALCVFALITIVVIAVRRRYRRAIASEPAGEHAVLNIGRRTKPVLILPIAIYIGSRFLTLEPQVHAFLGDVSSVCGILQVLFWIAGAIDVLIDRYRRRRLETDPAAITMIGAFRFAIVVVMWLVGILVALQNVGVNVSAFITGLGIGGVAVALALQSILSDLFASLSIVFDKPFVVGDLIAVGDDVGTVERIGLKTSRIRALSGEELVYSNSDLLKHQVHNYQRMAERRVVVRTGVTYQTPAETLERIPLLARHVIEDTPNVRFDRAHFAALGKSSYEFEFVYYVLSRDYNAYMDAQQTINVGIVRAFADHSIDLAYPTQALLLASHNEALRSAIL
jgi:small-conductance mechanosensitive channel